jgi:hypothetical protein
MRVRRQTVEHPVGTIKAWMLVNKRTPLPGGMNASTARFQHGEHARLIVVLDGVALGASEGQKRADNVIRK